MTPLHITGINLERQRHIPCRFYLACMFAVAFLSLFGAAAMAAASLTRIEAQLAAEARV